MKIICHYSRIGFLIVEPEVFVFPGGEVQVCTDRVETEHLIRIDLFVHLTSAEAIMELLMVTDALRRRIGSTPIHLMMPYVPYARQDRVCNHGEALAIKVFCNLINAQGFASVTISDPHSDVTAALLDRVIVIDASAKVDHVLRNKEFASGVTLVSPDAGAVKKTLNLAKRFQIKNVVFADKVRDTLTGNIEHIDVRGKIWGHLPLLVVDDICDGGRTFIELAKELKRVSAPNQQLYLYVTHGIFSKGVEVLFPMYTKVFTSCDWTNSNHPDVITINLKGN